MVSTDGRSLRYLLNVPCARIILRSFLVRYSIHGLLAQRFNRNDLASFLDFGTDWFLLWSKVNSLLIRFTRNKFFYQRLYRKIRLRIFIDVTLSLSSSKILTVKISSRNFENFRSFLKVSSSIKVAVAVPYAKFLNRNLKFFMNSYA